MKRTVILSLALCLALAGCAGPAAPAASSGPAGAASAESAAAAGPALRDLLPARLLPRHRGGLSDRHAGRRGAGRHGAALGHRRADRAVQRTRLFP